MVGVFATAFVVGFAAYLAKPMTVLAGLSAAGPAMPSKVSGGSGRLEIDGNAVTKAAGAIVTIETPTLAYRQVCRGGCDGLLIDYGLRPQAGAAVTVTGVDGRAVYDGGTYDDAGVARRLSEGPDGRLRMDRAVAP
jgi:hypothetical protein